ncbi:hypothetical protein [Cellulosimicrobium protaetiae]
MIELMPIPTENPGLKVRFSPAARGARRPLLVVGGLDTSPRGWGRIVRALEPKGYYIGPVLEGEFEETLPDLLHWRLRALVLDIAGVLVPKWKSLTPDQQDALRLLSSHIPVGGADNAPAWLAPLGDNEQALLPILFEHSSALNTVRSRPNGARSETNILTDLAAHVPSKDDLTAGMTPLLVGPTENPRDFGAAKRAAASLQEQGCTGREIGHYLATFGYVNAKGVVGAWHHQRLTEALPGIPR